MPETRRLTPDSAGVAEAAALLAAGGLVAFPTETVYGLGADATNGRAVAEIFAAKGRPRFNPLIAHLASAEAAERHGVLTGPARLVAEAFWPGPLTLVLPRRTDCRISDLTTAGLQTIALRVPEHALARELLTAAGCPVAAPSANVSGRVSPTTAAHVLDGLAGKFAAVLDGGPCPVGLESTILGFEGETPVLLRPGGLAAEVIAELLGRPLVSPASGAITAPGQLASHYAPGARLRLAATAPRPGEAWLGFGTLPDGVDGPSLNLSPEADLSEAAANLFSHLRALDAALAGQGVIAVPPIPFHGLGHAINDRLARAAAPR